VIRNVGIQNSDAEVDWSHFA